MGNTSFKTLTDYNGKRVRVRIGDTVQIVGDPTNRDDPGSRIPNKICRVAGFSGKSRIITDIENSPWTYPFSWAVKYVPQAKKKRLIAVDCNKEPVLPKHTPPPASNLRELYELYIGEWRKTTKDHRGFDREVDFFAGKALKRNKVELFGSKSARIVARNVEEQEGYIVSVIDLAVVCRIAFSQDADVIFGRPRIEIVDRVSEGTLHRFINIDGVLLHLLRRWYKVFCDRYTPPSKRRIKLNPTME